MAAVPASHTFVDGVQTSSEMNTYVRDVLNFLQNKPAAELRQTVVQSIPNAAWTALTFTTEDLDNDPVGAGGHSTTSNTSRYTAVYAGWYALGGVVAWAISTVGIRGACWAVNGTNVNAASVLLSASSALATRIPAASMRVFLSVGDYVELMGYQNTGGALNTEAVADSASRLSIGWDRLA